MNGVGSRNDRPPSNLSATAPRSSVNRPNPKNASTPFVDSSKSVQPHPYDLCRKPRRKLQLTRSAAPFLPSSLCYINPPHLPDPPHLPPPLFLNPRSELDSNQTAQPSASQSRRRRSKKPSLSVVEPNLPFLMYGPDPTVFNGVTDSHWNHDVVLDDGKSKQVSDNTGLVGEERMNQGCQDLNGEDLLLPHQMFGQEKYSVPINADQLEDKPCRSETVKPMPAEYALFNRYVAIDAPKTGAADAGYNVNKCIAAPYPPEYDQLKRSLAVDAPNTLEKSAEKVSAQKLNVQMLVDSMHNLSELLLFHVLDDACKLKERDHNVLKNVINNLNTCALKDAEQIIPAQECLSPKPETSGGAGESCELQQNSNLEKLTKVGPESSQVELENSLDLEAKNLHLRSENPHGKLLDYVSSRDKAEMTKEDKMTKALKKILSENFHDDDEADSQTVLYKNLWLEAEAALCSVSYSARYNQMKIGIKNHSNKQKDTEEQSNPEVVPSLSENAATKVHIDPNHDSLVQDLLELNSTFRNCINGLQFSADMNKPNTMIPEVKDTKDLDSSIQNSTISCTNKEVEDDDASVTARSRVFKAWTDKLSINTYNLEGPSDIADKLAPRERDNQKQINLIQDSPIRGINKADYVASVRARWIKDSSSISSERKLSDDDTIIAEDDASEGNSFNVHVNPSGARLISFTAVEKSVPKEEYLLDFDNPQEIPLCGTCDDDNQLPTYYPNDLASDWEYV